MVDQRLRLERGDQVLIAAIDRGITERKAAEAAETMAEAGVALVTHGAGGLPMPPIEMPRAAGVLVFAGNDDIRDTWSPYGTGDLLPA